MLQARTDSHHLCRGCDHGWIWVMPGPVPTVMPCWAHRPLLRVLWEAGNFLPEVADWWADAGVIIRVEHRDHYTVVRNETVRDSRLSLKARGLLVYLLSLPDDTLINRKRLAEIGPDGEKAIRSALKELVDSGYLERHRVRSADGRRLITESVLREQPQKCGGPKGASTNVPTTRVPTTRRSSQVRSNKEGPAHASPPPPPEYVCAACGVKADYMRRDETWWCKEHYHGAGLRVVGHDQA